jgi:hypothetical protein
MPIATHACSAGLQACLRVAICFALPILILAEHDAPLLAALSLRQVIERAGAYAASYGSELESVVADEDFLQELVSRPAGAVLQQRRLQSEIAFVELADTNEWLAFRNVLRVDGTAVRDSADQLERVFRDAPRTALAQARALTAESSRFNLGPVQRNFNVPTTVLQFILPRHQDRFRFRKAGEERIEGEREPAWIVEFREQRAGTFVRTPEGRAAPSEGRLWIMPEDGRVVRSHLAVKSEIQAQIDVAWTYEIKLKLWVPSEMRESYRGPWTTEAGNAAKETSFDVRGLATYSNYRRFQVDTRILR